jgi:hypothetical protein
MKHINHYHDWQRVHESEEDQELEDLKHLVDLGFAEPHQVKAMYREKYAVPRRVEFLAKLRGAFAQLGIEPNDLTTPRQAKNGTFFFQLTPAQVEKLLFEYPLPKGLSRRQESHLRNTLDGLSPQREEMRKRDKIDQWGIPGPGGMRRSHRYQYLVLPRDMRGTSWDRTPTSSGFMKFDGDKDVDWLLARFIFQLALDSPSQW